MKEDISEYYKKRKDPSEKEVTLLLEQVDGLCPLCNKPITNYKKGTKTLQFEVAHIYPNKPTLFDKLVLQGVPLLGTSCEDIQNKIPLCKSCHDDYDRMKTREKYMQLYAIKQSKQNQLTVKQLLAKEQIEEKLVELVRKLNAVSEKEIKQSEKERPKVLHVDEKISAENFKLRQKVTTWVTSYFSYISNQCKDQGFPTSKYNVIRARMRLNYLTAKSEGLTEKEIFSSLTEWLMNKTYSDRETCEIMVSYFIQNCDIYGKDAE